MSKQNKIMKQKKAALTTLLTLFMHAPLMIFLKNHSGEPDPAQEIQMVKMTECVVDQSL